MQRLSLQEPLYQEFYRAGQILRNYIHQTMNRAFHMNTNSEELYGRTLHQLLMHSPKHGFIHDTSIQHERFELLEEVQIIVFEVM
jgi:hypothetical protein